MSSENAVSFNKQNWQQWQHSCSGREEAVMTVGSKNYCGRGEQHVGEMLDGAKCERSHLG